MGSWICSLLIIASIIVEVRSVNCRDYLTVRCQGYVGGSCCDLTPAGPGQTPVGGIGQAHSVYCAPGATEYIQQRCNPGEECKLIPTYDGSKYVDVPACVYP